MIAVLFGLAALIGGAEMLVRGGTALAARLKISPIIIGATVVAIGTSAPELGIGIDAAVRGSGALALGNIAGTNILNLLLIFGLMAVLRPIALRSQLLRLDLPIVVISSGILLILALDGLVSITDGLTLLGLGAVYTLLLVSEARRAARAVDVDVVVTGTGRLVHRPIRPGRLIDTVLLVLGVVGIVLGAQWLVDGALEIATQLGASESVIGLTIVAVGTSAPELATAIVASIRQRTDIAVGNLLGSSIYNILVIFGITTLASGEGIIVEQSLLDIDLPIMTLAAIICIPIFVTGHRIRRWEGAAMIVSYAGYLASVIFLRL